MVGVLNEATIVVDDHVNGRLSTNSAHIDLRVLDIDHILLVVLLGCVVLLIVIEEAVHAS